MWYLILGIFALGVVAAAFGYFRNRKEEQSAGGPAQVTPPDCCGQHEVCERDALLAAVSQQIEYYDDEELDRFRGTEAGTYTDEAVDAFREVLYTLRPAEVSGWLHSLQLREINLPVSLQDEAFLIIREQRIHA